MSFGAIIVLIMPPITSIKAREILDSRGNPTIEVEVYAGNVVGIASVPSGMTTGSYEAIELRDGGTRYRGNGVLKAVRNVNKILAPKLVGFDCSRQQEIDNLLIKLDGTKNKSKLGANALLGVSLACARVGANTLGLPLYLYIHQLLGLKREIKLPQPFFNVINGSKHAGNLLSIQEYFIIPKVKKFSKALRMGVEVYQTLKKIIEKEYGRTAINVGDEGGFAPPLKRTEEALHLLLQAIAAAGYKGKVDLGVDCAASQFFNDGVYNIDGRKMNAQHILNYYLQLIRKYHLISVEDPFEENDFTSFALLQNKSGIQIVGDDLTVTNVGRIKNAIKTKSCNCLLLKVNQIGTLTEALDAVRLAYANGWKVMVSHRSGETEDTFIADLAVGIGCGMIKAGAPCRGERVAKYNRLGKIEERMRNE